MKNHINEMVPLNAFNNLLVDVVYSYAKPVHEDSPLINQFPGLYHPKAQIIWCHRDLAAITVIAAQLCWLQFGWRIRVADSLRPIEAQEGMANYGFDPILVSIPGSGAHPRGMAIDIVPEYKQNNEWHLVDMGVPFDFFSENPDVDNPAARNYTKFECPNTNTLEVYLNRQRLEFAMRRAATLVNKIIWPLDQEWWDFRFLPDVTNNYAPLSEQDLPGFMRMINPDLKDLERIVQAQYPHFISSNIAYVNQLVKSTEHIQSV